MVKDGIPYVLIPLAVAVVFGIMQVWPVMAPFAFVALFMRYFFRDPARIIPNGEGLIVSAADGRVTRIEDGEDSKLVSVFLSPLDVHINRSPIRGVIKNITYTEGKKLPATNDNTSFLNERNSLVIEGEGMTITCTQIAGILARRIVCWPKSGDNLQRGQKFGLIKFGSRTDVRMPGHVKIVVSVGDRVKGGETIIAKLSEPPVLAGGPDAVTSSTVVPAAYAAGSDL